MYGLEEGWFIKSSSSSVRPSALYMSSKRLHSSSNSVNGTPCILVISSTHSGSLFKSSNLGALSGLELMLTARESIIAPTSTASCLFVSAFIVPPLLSVLVYTKVFQIDSHGVVIPYYNVRTVLRSKNAFALFSIMRNIKVMF
ncbi:hypothetical protein BSP15_200 [Bacillus phage BSP15]|nr:hypothetical protein BSP15_200 [Bacillus phage BSP15]